MTEDPSGSLSKQSERPNLPAETSPAKLNGQQVYKDFLNLADKIPTEGWLKIIETISELRKANKLMEINEKKYKMHMRVLTNKQADRSERIQTLTSLIESREISAEDRSEIIRAICNIALGNYV